ncbi:hypothetical protein NDU88_008970 [Pleurodeles waltl]|uniref:Uncharacterized protein n=1 Tax=Pleurodeles waltl TaxID=8319 RepID=A0AAV7RTY6_PLEWA|nr:hypothetical protein NDU88_008970 [Pleurodeles waltl]
MGLVLAQSWPWHMPSHALCTSHAAGAGVVFSSVHLALTGILTAALASVVDYCSVLQAEGRSDADRGLQQALRASPHPPGGTALEASTGRRAPLYSRPRPRSAPTRASPSKAAPQGRSRTPVAPPVTAASPLLPRSGSSLAQCVNASSAGRPGRGLLAVPISPGHSGTRSGGVRPHLRDLPFHGTRRLPLRTPEHPPQRLQAPMQSRPLRSRSFKRAPCSAPWPRPRHRKRVITVIKSHR